MKNGIYGIRNKVNNKIYVGQAYRKKGVESRFGEHKRLLVKGGHYNEYLQRAWNKYGSGNFEFIILEEVDDVAKLDDREQYWIDISWENCYNIQLTAGGSCRGKKHKEETKHKIGEANRIRIWTEESRSKQSKSQKERFLKYGTPDSVREYRRKSQLGRKHADEVKQRISQANIGRKISDETRAKISSSRMGLKQSQESINKKSKTIRMKPSRNGYKGVRKRIGKTWCARIEYNRRQINLGSFYNEVEAAMNYDYYAINLFGIGNCFVNFPNNDYSNFVPKKKIRSFDA